MTIRNLGFRDLQYIVAVAEHASISRAADACAITQPALSERIKRIEHTLDVELFERNRRSLSVTPVGERVVGRARQLLDEAIDIDEIVSAARQPLTGPLHVGVIATLGPYLVPHLLPVLRNKYPNLELVLHEGITDVLLDSLQAGSLDIVIAAAPLKASNIAQLPLFDEPFVLAVPADHPLTGKKSISASDLRGEDMVLLDDGHCLAGQALDVCPARQRRNTNRLHAMSLETLRHMVAAGAGYSLMPALSVGSSPPLSELICYRDLGGQRQYGRKIVMGFRKSFGRTDDLKLLAEEICCCLADKLNVPILSN